MNLTNGRMFGQTKSSEEVASRQIKLINACPYIQRKLSFHSVNLDTDEERERDLGSGRGEDKRM